MKKKPTEQQLANLRKGFEALKEKRKKKEEEEAVAEAVAEAVVEPVVEAVAEPVVKPERKKREKKVAVAFDPEAFKNSLLSELRVPPVERIVEVEKPVEKIVEKVVFKERVLTGSEILNKLFNF